MSEGEHTPGPWVVNGAGGTFERIATLKPAGVAVSAHSEPLPAKEIPNARLIAAAPDLLAALRLVLEDSLCAIQHGENKQCSGCLAVRAARAAIAKAEGR